MQVETFYKTKVPSGLQNSALFKRAVLKALGKTGALNGIINVIFVSEAEIHKINKQFLGHDYVTDVITFPYAFDKKEKDFQPFGDIFICYKTAKQNSSLYGHSVLEEMLMYAVHGALHLLGMEDDTATKRAAMDKKTYKILKTL